MGAAMAGMLVPRLSVLPSSVWVVIFAIAAAWFGWRAVRSRGFTAAGPLSRFPVPHLIESVAMLYMLLPVHGPLPAHGRAGMAAAGMGPSTGPAGSLPVLAVLLAMFMLGYIVWTTDRLASLARARTATQRPRPEPGPGVTGRGPDGGTPRRCGRCPRHPGRRDRARGPGWPASARARARRMRQARDEYHHGLHAHGHALAPGRKLPACLPGQATGSASGRDGRAVAGPGASGDGGAGMAGSSTSNTEPWPSVLLARAEP
jgi:hypothetical protein